MIIKVCQLKKDKKGEKGRNKKQGKEKAQPICRD